MARFPKLQNLAWRRYLTTRSVAAAVLAIGLVVLWTAQISEAAIERDATESTRMAVNLARHGVMSLDNAAPFRPTNYREPVPVIVSALGVKVIDSILGASEPNAYLQGPRTKYLKYQNLLWLGLLTLSAFWAVRLLTSSFWFGLLGAALVNHPLVLQQFSPVDNLLTELPATAILLIASISLAVAFTRRQLPLFFFAGLMFGILALIKAIAFYVFIGLLAALAGLYLLQRPRIPWRTAAQQLLTLMIACGCVVAPWLYRNHVQLGTLQITQRGGESLWERALEDQISAPEYLGAFYIWARPGYLQDWLGRRLHFSADDLQRGGSLQRLNTDFYSPLLTEDLAAVNEGSPGSAITLFRQAEAERTRLQRNYAAAGHPHPDVAAEQAMYANAEALIAAHPWRHLALTAAFMWRGAAQTLPILVIGLLVGLWRKRCDVVLLLLPAFGIVMIYALFTPFFPRYGWPSRLIAILAILLLIKLTWDAISSRAARLTSQMTAPGSCPEDDEDQFVQPLT